MQNKESRLIQAARRTLRAEAILVVLILVIVSWSIFGLYKLSTGSDTIFGYSFGRASKDSLAANGADSGSNLSNLDLREELKINGRNFGSYKLPLNRSYNTPAADANRNRLLRELLDGQAELYSNLSPAERLNIDSPSARLFRSRPAKKEVDREEAAFSEHQPNLYMDNNQLAAAAAANNQPPEEELGPIRDREPAESKQDDNESYVEAGGEPMPTGSGTQTAAYDAGAADYQPAEVGEDNSVVAEDGAEEPLEDGADGGQVEGDVIGPEQNSDSEEPTLAEEHEQAKEGSAEVDDEVDKMTQPSLGVARQQSIPFDYTNTVKFDDSAQPVELVASKESNLKNSLNRTSSVTREATSKRNNSTVPVLVALKKITATKQEALNKSSPVELAEKVAKKVKKDKTEVKLEKPNKRVKRMARDNVIQAPYEMDNYFNSFNLDGLIDSVFQQKIKEAEVESIQGGASNITELSLPIKSIVLNRKKDSNKKRQKKRKVVELVPSESLTNIRRNSNATRRQDTLDYLNNLINSTNLLKAYKHSQLPAPTLSYNMSTSEPKVSSSQKHIDFDALLNPLADSKHLQISNYKKNKKHEKVASKRKTALATSKGGHKKKKLDKEEKKFLKEKRFKGAKKGKKVTKGQGGSGGKKGKKLFKDRGYKKKGFKNVAHKEEWGHKKSYFDEFRDKDFKKKWKKFDDKYNYAQMKKFQAKDEKGAKRLKEHDEKFKKNDNGKWKKSFQKHSKEHKELSQKKKKKKKAEDFD